MRQGVQKLTEAAEGRRVAVLLPAYQAARFIIPTLESISAQTFSDFQVIVSVDYSTDETFEICAEHARRDPRFQVRRQDKRLGYVRNCNFLLSITKAEFAFFAFHDDLIAPLYVERLFAALDGNPQAVLSYSDMEVTQASGETKALFFDGISGVPNRVQRGLRMLRRPNGWWVPNRGLFRMAAARRVRGLKVHSAGEFMTDWPWLFHLSLMGEFIRVPETLCFKFFKEGSISKGWAYSKAQIVAANTACMREVWNSELSDAEKLLIAKPLMDFLMKNTTQFEA